MIIIKKSKKDNENLETEIYNLPHRKNLPNEGLKKKPDKLKILEKENSYLNDNINPKNIEIREQKETFKIPKKDSEKINKFNFKKDFNKSSYKNYLNLKKKRNRV